MRRAAVAAAFLGLLAAGLAEPEVHARVSACAQGRVQPATLSIEGNLYAVVRANERHYAFGGSGPTVSTFAEALTLIRHLGFKGTTAQLLRRLDGQIPGVTFAGGSGSSD